MQESMDQKNSEYGHSLSSVYDSAFQKKQRQYGLKGVITEQYWKKIQGSAIISRHFREILLILIMPIHLYETYQSNVCHTCQFPQFCRGTCSLNSNSRSYSKVQNSHGKLTY